MIENRHKLYGAIAGIVLIGGCTAKGLTRVKPGMEGVVYSPNGGVKEETLSQGWHLVNPFYKVSPYTVATEQAYLSMDKREGSKGDDSIMIVTKDGKTVSADLEFSYKYDAERVAELFTRFKGRSGKEIEQTYIRGKIKAYVNDVSSKFTVIEIYGEKRSELNSAVFQHVRQKFEKDGIIIESVNFSRIMPDPATKDAIQKVVNAQQQLAQQRITNEKAKLSEEKKLIEENAKAERRKIKATAEAEERTIRANAKAEELSITSQAEADAIKIKAKAEADANKKIKASLTPALVEYNKVNKWNGELPQVTGGATPIIKMD